MRGLYRPNSRRNRIIMGAKWKIYPLSMMLLGRCGTPKQQQTTVLSSDVHEAGNGLRCENLVRYVGHKFINACENAETRLSRRVVGPIACIRKNGYGLAEVDLQAVWPSQV